MDDFKLFVVWRQWIVSGLISTDLYWQVRNSTITAQQWLGLQIPCKMSGM